MITDPEVDEYILQFPDEFVEIMMRLRELIHQVVPETSEAIKWSRPHFSMGCHPVCYIGGFKKHVTLAFHDGRMLNDPDKILLGTGKKMKYLKFRSVDELDEEKLRKWIVEGFYT
jgi:hypothetical protein